MILPICKQQTKKLIASDVFAFSDFIQGTLLVLFLGVLCLTVSFFLHGLTDFYFLIHCYSVY